MAYRMTELTEHVRVGKMSDGSLDIEVWENAKGWAGFGDKEPQEIFIPSDAVDALFEFLR